MTQLDAYLGTPELRSKAIVSLSPIARHRIDFVIGKRRRWAEGYFVGSVLHDMETLDARLTGEETIDKVAWKSLLSDLRALNAEIMEFRKTLGKASQVSK